MLRHLSPLLVLLAACGSDPTQPLPPDATASLLSLTTDKARYDPGQPVSFSLSATAPTGAVVRYKSLGAVIAENAASGTTWTWTPPSGDFTGYMAEVHATVAGADRVIAAVGVDVSSSWTKFPRYGFLSNYPDMSAQAMSAVIANLNQYHLNGLQFYDWQWKHDRPLAGTPASPTPVYKDISNRDIHFATVKAYIDSVHGRNMKAMFYNLAFGAWSDAASDGVAEEWYLYTDQSHGTKDKHPLPQPPFLSDIFLLNPADAGWQSYLINETRKVYAALPFDGFHIDQLGFRETPDYTYSGTLVDLAASYEPFITAVKADRPDKYVVMNAVDQYGQSAIARAPTDFLYTEVWYPNETYASLADIILTNNTLGGGGKPTVLAAYVNYDLAQRPGFFNTPAVLLADAVIFAFGGDHLELGEHMLGREYFPDDNLAMGSDLRDALVHYYDFLVAYQNLLRDGGVFDSPGVSSTSGISISQWAPQRGQVAVVGKEVGNRQVIHLLNFISANSPLWRDNAGTQPVPQSVGELKLSYTTTRQVKRVWFASPDVDAGASKEIAFTQTASEVTFTLPSLAYWDMVVVEYP
jgi:dextranase